MNFKSGSYMITAIDSGTVIKCENCRRKWFDTYHWILDEDGRERIYCGDCFDLISERELKQKVMEFLLSNPDFEFSLWVIADILNSDIVTIDRMMGELEREKFYIRYTCQGSDCRGRTTP